MKTVIGLLLISFTLFIVNHTRACEGGEWEDRVHDHRRMADGHGGDGTHTHADWKKVCADGTVRVNPGYTDAHAWGDALRDDIDDFPEITLQDPNKDQSPKNPQPPNPNDQPELNELPPPDPNAPQPSQAQRVVPKVTDEPTDEPPGDTGRGGESGDQPAPDRGNADPQGLPPLPDVTPENPTENPTQNPAESKPQATQEQHKQTGVTPQPQVTPQTTVDSVQQPLLLTEYMVRDWTQRTGGNLPQWIELYNPNPNAILLHNCVFSYVVQKKKVKHVQINNFTIPAGKAVILVTRAVNSRSFGGVTAEQIYDLKIGNWLKNGWLLRTAGGGVIANAGKMFGSSLPHAPKHANGARQSHSVVASEPTSTAYFYGSASDIGTPGYHEPITPAAPRLLRKQIDTWGALKRGE